MLTVELFVFLQVGGSISNVTVIPMSTGKTDEQKQTTLVNLIQTLKEFDANGAQCYRESDKQKLLTVIERGCATRTCT